MAPGNGYVDPMQHPLMGQVPQHVRMPPGSVPTSSQPPPQPNIAQARGPGPATGRGIGAAAPPGAPGVPGRSPKKSASGEMLTGLSEDTEDAALESALAGLQVDDSLVGVPYGSSVFGGG